MYNTVVYIHDPDVITPNYAQCQSWNRSFKEKFFLSPVSYVHQVNFWVFLVLKTSFPHYILQRGPHRWGFHTKNFAVFPCVSSFANANVAIVFVLCSACPIVLTRPTDAGRLKEKKENEIRHVHTPSTLAPFSVTNCVLIQNFLT